jgi:endoglucanase
MSIKDHHMSPTKHPSLMTSTLRCCAILAGFLSSLMADAPVPLPQIGNGDFQTAKEGHQQPLGWAIGKYIRWEQEGENRFLRINVDESNKMLSVYRRIYLKKPIDALNLSYKVRYRNLKPGKANWHDGRVALNFKGDKDKKLGGTVAGSFRGDQAEWKSIKKDFLVPKGTRYIELMPAVFKAKSGQIDFDDFEFQSAKANDILAAIEAKKQAKLADVARRAALVKAQVPVANPENYPDELMVSGNVLISKKTGNMVWLQGVSIASLEWSAGGDHILKSLDVAINDWKSNCIRLAIREDFYEGVGPYQRDGGASYRQLIQDAVNYCADRGVYIVLDLHRFRAPIQAHLEFWIRAATQYKNHPAVLFDLVNEPHSISWDVWKNGGMVNDKKSSKPDIAVENNEKLRKEYCIGMQFLLDELRKTGAKNIAIIGGLDWAYDLSGILKGYAIDDPKGNGVVYSTHIYPWKKNWQTKFMDIAAVHPLFIGEVGCQPEPMPWQKKTEDPKIWAPDMLGLIQDLKLNWTAWCFHPSSSPCILLDWNYTPTPYWGAYVKEALAGKAFPRGKLR